MGVNGGRLVGQSDWSAVRVPGYLPAPSFYDQRGRAGGVKMELCGTFGRAEPGF